MTFEQCSKPWLVVWYRGWHFLPTYIGIPIKPLKGSLLNNQYFREYQVRVWFHAAPFHPPTFPTPTNHHLSEVGSKCARVDQLLVLGMGNLPPLMTGIRESLFHGALFSPLRNWVDEFIPYDMELMGVDRPWHKWQKTLPFWDLHHHHRSVIPVQVLGGPLSYLANA